MATSVVDLIINKWMYFTTKYVCTLLFYKLLSLLQN
jgi:hypothetical protein